MSSSWEGLSSHLVSSVATRRTSLSLTLTIDAVIKLEPLVGSKTACCSMIVAGMPLLELRYPRGDSISSLRSALWERSALPEESLLSFLITTRGNHSHMPSRAAPQLGQKLRQASELRIWHCEGNAESAWLPSGRSSMMRLSTSISAVGVASYSTQCRGPNT